MKFIKMFMASLLAFLVGSFALYMLAVASVAGLASLLSSAPYSAGPKSVLRLNLGEITDSPSESPLAGLDLRSLSLRPSTSLYSALSAIEYAALDENIEGIYINLDEWTSVSGADLEELRQAVGQFKSDGKFVVAYSDSYSQMEYYLASVADRVYVNPQGCVDLHGLAMQTMFFKGLLDRLGVEPVIIRHGTYKAAVEPYIADRMSPENRQQLAALAGSVWDGVVEQIALSRGLSPEEINGWIDNLELVSAEDALKRGLVDGLMYESQVMDMLGRLVEMPAGELTAAERIDAAAGSSEKGGAVKMAQFPEYAAWLEPNPIKASEPKIGIIYIDGQIVDGQGDGDDTAGSHSVSELLARARDDKQTKAVVLRVNSPGGSALAAEIMWHEVERLRQVKPVVVSMGAYAASGGYYVSCPADVIFADRFTVTGSIGVFGMYLNAGKALRDKLGITVDEVTTNKWSDMGSVFRGMSAPEMDFARQQVEQVYDTFVNRVSAGRNLTAERVDQLGQGRVWSGSDAVQTGLADQIGGFKQAICVAADRAGIAENFRIEEITAQQDAFTMIVRALSGVRSARLKNELGQGFALYKRVMQMRRSESGVMARMPFDVEIY